jgi:hypothetical protein
VASLRFSATLVLLLAVASPTARAERTLVASTNGASQSLVDDALRRVRDRGHEVVTFQQLEGTLLDARQLASDALGRKFQQAKDFYVGERYNAAIAQLTAEETSSLHVLIETESGRAVLVQLNLWLGCLQLAARQTLAAESRFRLALALDAAAALDPVLWPPEYVEAFSNAKASIQANGQVTIQLPTLDAIVSIDGRVQGFDANHATLTLPAGEHYLFVHAPGLARVAKRFEVTRAGVSSLRVVSTAASVTELAHDVRNMQPTWLGESALWRLALLRSSGAASMVVVRGTGPLFYDHDGRRTKSLGGNVEGKQLPADRLVKKPSTAQPLYKRWWLWTGVAAVVGGSVAIWATRDSATVVHGEFVR